MPQAPDRTSRWTTFTKPPGSPLSSMLCPGGGTRRSQLYLCTVRWLSPGTGSRPIPQRTRKSGPGLGVEDAPWLQPTKCQLSRSRALLTSKSKPPLSPPISAPAGRFCSPSGLQRPLTPVITKYRPRDLVLTPRPHPSQQDPRRPHNSLQSREILNLIPRTLSPCWKLGTQSRAPRPGD